MSRIGLLPQGCLLQVSFVRTSLPLQEFPCPPLLGFLLLFGTASSLGAFYPWRSTDPFSEKPSLGIPYLLRGTLPLKVYSTSQGISYPLWGTLFPWGYLTFLWRDTLPSQVPVIVFLSYSLKKSFFKDSFIILMITFYFFFRQTSTARDAKVQCPPDICSARFKLEGHGRCSTYAQCVQAHRFLPRAVKSAPSGLKPFYGHHLHLRLSPMNLNTIGLQYDEPALRLGYIYTRVMRIWLGDYIFPMAVVILQPTINRPVSIYFLLDLTAFLSVPTPISLLSGIFFPCFLKTPFSFPAVSETSQYQSYERAQQDIPSSDQLWETFSQIKDLLEHNRRAVRERRFHLPATSLSSVASGASLQQPPLTNSGAEAHHHPTLPHSMQSPPG